ncbi:DnaJ-class molecular chaperone [Aureococcus anophagefferens]|nr:DnaJ-class molecular chaperone [Aureococcus anophagefferens]
MARSWGFLALALCSYVTTFAPPTQQITRYSTLAANSARRRTTLSFPPSRRGRILLSTTVAAEVVNATAPAEASAEAPAPPSRRETHYDALGLRRDATDAQIRSSYRTMSKTCHPDVDPSEASRAKFDAINEAYATLKTAKTRDAYDYELRKEDLAESAEQWVDDALVPFVRDTAAPTLGAVGWVMGAAFGAALKTARANDVSPASAVAAAVGFGVGGPVGAAAGFAASRAAEGENRGRGRRRLRRGPRRPRRGPRRRHRGARGADLRAVDGLGARRDADDGARAEQRDNADGARAEQRDDADDARDGAAAAGRPRRRGRQAAGALELERPRGPGALEPDRRGDGAERERRDRGGAAETIRDAGIAARAASFRGAAGFVSPGDVAAASGAAAPPPKPARTATPSKPAVTPGIAARRAAELAAERSEEAPVDQEAPADVAKLTRSDLRRILLRRGMDASGPRSELVKRVRKLDLSE